MKNVPKFRRDESEVFVNDEREGTRFQNYNSSNYDRIPPRPHRLNDAAQRYAGKYVSKHYLMRSSTKRESMCGAWERQRERESIGEVRKCVRKCVCERARERERERERMMEIGIYWIDMPTRQEYEMKPKSMLPFLTTSQSELCRSKEILRYLRDTAISIGVLSTNKVAHLKKRQNILFWQ